MHTRPFNIIASFLLAFVLAACAHAGTVAPKHPDPAEGAGFPTPVMPDAHGPARITPDQARQSATPDEDSRAQEHGGNAQPSEDEIVKAIMAQMDLKAVFGIIQKNYVRKDVKLSTLAYGMVQGAVNALGDPHSEFFPPEEAKKFKDQFEGNVSGIGAMLKPVHNMVVVGRVIKGSPAEKAGLKAGDIIAKIDGALVEDAKIDAIVRRIRGEAGTKVTVGVTRKGVDHFLDFEITRAEVVAPALAAKVVKRGSKRFLRISMTQFNEDALTRFQEAAASIAGHPVDGIVLDLRSNLGGMTKVAGEVVCSWGRDQPYMQEVGRDGVVKPIACPEGDAPFHGIPTVVLVDGFSASASEITAGSLQDSGAAVIVGVKTFGKGSEQVVIPFPDDSMLKLTMKHWLTSGGHAVDGIGITPDIEIHYDPDAAKRSKDVQLERAYLRLSTGK